MQWLRKALTEIGQVSAALMTTIGGFVLPPPVGFFNTNVQVWPKFGAYVIAILTALIMVIGHRTKQQRHTKGWFLAAAISLVLAVAGFFGYLYVTSTRTCGYYEETRVIGSELSADGSDYIHDHPTVPCQELLKAFGGQSRDIWTERSILQSQLLLSITYMSVLPLLAVACVASLQAMRCSRSHR